MCMHDVWRLGLSARVSGLASLYAGVAYRVSAAALGEVAKERYPNKRAKHLRYVSCGFVLRRACGSMRVRSFGCMRSMG